MSDQFCNKKEPSPVRQDSIVTFLVGPEKTEFTIEKEKLSEILHSMDQFIGGKYEVNIPVDSFRVFVSMIENENVEITSATMAFDLLGLAKKLICFQLSNMCVDYFKANYECDRAIAIYEYAKTNKLIDFKKSCLGYIATNFKSFIGNEDFLALKNVETIADFYACDDLNVTELELVEALITYAKRQNNDDMRSQMRVALDKIHFQNMDFKKLLQLEDINDLFTDEELLHKVVENYEYDDVGFSRKRHVVPIHLHMGRNYKIDSEGRMTCTLTFSQDVFIETIQINREIVGKITEIIMNVGETKNVPVARLITVNHYITKGNSVRLMCKMNECLYENILGNVSTKANGVRINPKEITYGHIFLIESIILKRIDTDDVLDINYESTYRRFY